MSNKVIDLFFLIENLKTLEGFRPSVYKDATGTPTIGYGFTSSRYVNRGHMTEVEASRILRDIVVMNYEKVCIYLSDNGYNDIPLNVLVALTDFTYNCGYNNFKMLTDYGKRDMETIKKKILEYDKSKGVKLKGLTKRRKWEQDLMNNKYSMFKY